MIEAYRAAPESYKPTLDGTRAECVDLYRKLLSGFTCLTCKAPIEVQRLARDYVLLHVDQLRGRDLACWCPLDGPCHADVLLEAANAAPEDSR